MVHSTNLRIAARLPHAPTDWMTVRAAYEDAFQRVCDQLGPVAIGEALGRAHTTVIRRAEVATEKAVPLIEVYARHEQDAIAHLAATRGFPELLQAFERGVMDPGAAAGGPGTVESALRGEQRADAKLSLTIGEILDADNRCDPSEAARLIPMVEARMARDRDVVIPRLVQLSRNRQGGRR